MKLQLTTMNWELCFGIAPNRRSSDSKPAILESSRWIAGRGTAKLIDDSWVGPERSREVVAASNNLLWTISPELEGDDKASAVRMEKKIDRNRGTVGVGEVALDSGYINVNSIGSTSFEWIVRAFESSGGKLLQLEFDATRTDRGTLVLESMHIGLGGSL